MELQTIYPHNARNFVLKENNLYCDDTQINILKKISEKTFKISINGILYGFVHDGKYCAYDLWQKNYLVYNQEAWFIKMPKYNSLFCDISKNACTTVTSEIYNNCFRYFWERKVKTSEFIWHKNKFNQRFHKIKYETNNYFNENKSWNTIFFIYDDPIKRFVRVLNYKYCKGNNNEILSSINEPFDTNLQIFISKFILLTRLNLLNEKTFDQHIAPISTWIKDIENEFTDVVEIENLEKFMFDKFRIKPKRYNVSMKRLITISDLTQEHINDIKNIYKEDYQIPIKFADKLYK